VYEARWIVMYPCVRAVNSLLDWFEAIEVVDRAIDKPSSSASVRGHRSISLQIDTPSPSVSLKRYAEHENC
jgi:hypothetical protein